MQEHLYPLPTMNLIEFWGIYSRAKNPTDKQILLKEWIDAIPEKLRDGYCSWLLSQPKRLQMDKPKAKKIAEEAFGIPEWLFEACVQETKDWRRVFAALPKYPESSLDFEFLKNESELYPAKLFWEEEVSWYKEFWPQLSPEARLFLLEREKKGLFPSLGKLKEFLNKKYPKIEKPIVPKGVRRSLPFHLLYHRIDPIQEQFIFGTEEGLPVLALDSHCPLSLRKALRDYAKDNAFQKFGPVVSVKKGLIAKVSFSLIQENRRKKAGLEILDPEIEEILTESLDLHQGTPLQELKEILHGSKKNS